MRTRSAVPLLAAALAAGCAVGAPVVGPTAKPSAPATKASASPRTSASPTGLPSASPTAGLATGRKRAPKLPERVNLLLPPALGLVAAGGGNLIGADGATLIGNDAGSLVAAGAGNLVAAGAGNLISEDGSTMIAAGGGNARAANGYLLAQAAPPSASPSAAASPCGPPPATGALFFRELVQTNMAVYVENVVLVNRVLRQLREADLGPDEPYTFELANYGTMTALLRAAPEGDGGVLLVADGAAFDRSKLAIGMQFTSATVGKVVTRPKSLDEIYGRLAFVTTFDLATGAASADGTGFKAADAAAGVPETKIRAHWEFRAARGEAAAQPAFQVRTAANFQFAGNPCESGPRVMTLNYGADGRGACRMGRVQAGQADVTFTRRDGQGYVAEAGPDTAFFVKPDGDPLEAPAAEDALWGLVPGAVDIYRPFPAAPGAGDPLEDPIFTFPE